MAAQVTAFDQAERRAWSGRAAPYARSFARVCAYTVPFVLDAASINAGMRVLDVGTGTGAVAAAATARGAEITAVDAEPSMLRLAAQAAPGARLCAGALPGLPFADGTFTAVVGNFVLNHVGQPRVALAEMRRVAAPGGHVAVTIWSGSPAAGQVLLGQAMQAAEVVRPVHLPTLTAADDFPRTEAGLAELLRGAGFSEVSCSTLHWEHCTDREEWWSGPAAGVATVGQILTSQPHETITKVRRHYMQLSEQFVTPDGRLALPHTALLAHGQP
jgi:2-polyprenyl-3-methyl-5-hydroxy-6-metoxy-1,4-benzoquinol methylase